MKILKNLYDRAVDKYLTWRTGETAEERVLNKWADENVVLRANTVENIFMNFKYVIPVKPDLWFDLSHPFGWVPKSDVTKFLYPNRELGDNTVYLWLRVSKNQWDGFRHIDELGGTDMVFAATNNDMDAMMISLKYQA